ncbi:hypothetical protein JHK85_028587 [Glycine max]|nr:hypothetical protein JHK85_028587 [Glycine max]
MMFKKQCKVGTETFKAPSYTTIKTPFGMSSNATKDSLSKNEIEASQVLDHCRSGPDQVNGSTRVEEGSLEKCGKPDSSKTQHAIANHGHGSEGFLAYKSYRPSSGSSNGNRNRKYADSDMGSDSARFNWSYQRIGSSNSTPTMWGNEVENGKVKGISSGEGTLGSVSGRTELVMFMEEDEPKEGIAQVEPSVLITFVSLPHGGNDLKRIQFKWWAENYDKVMELYSVQRFNQQLVPLPTLPRSEDENIIKLPRQIWKVDKLEKMDEGNLVDPRTSPEQVVETKAI